MYRRYIDDMFFIWYGTEEELLHFIEHCNNFHETIKFEFSYNFKTRAVDFLDMTIWIDHNGFIQTDLFKKPGKKCQYLQPDSAHPKHCTRSIPYSLSLRLRRICSMAPEPSDDCPPLVDWKQHWDSRKRKVRTAPTQLNSRLEDLVNDLKR
jgi:hypothetical protein